MIYLDNNATTKVDNRVLKKMMPFFSEYYANPHSQLTKHNKEIINSIEKARKEIADLIGANTQEIFFTSGATESNNLAIKGLDYKIKRGKNHFITLNTEHKCVLEALKKLELYGAKVTILKVSKNGLINLELLKKTITSNTVLVSVMMANNETGVIQPIKEIARICKEKKVLLHTDGAQAVGKIKIDVKKLKIDMLSISAHKFYGPKGIGALYVNSNPRVRLNNQIDGGGQEKRLRSGTLPVPLCIGIGEAARIARNEMGKEATRTRLLRNYLIEEIKKKISDIGFNGSLENRLPANINFFIKGIKSVDLISKLKQIVISAGSACTSQSVEPSYVLKGMGLEKEIVEASFRIGIGRFNTKREIDIAVEEIVKLTKKMRK